MLSDVAIHRVRTATNVTDFAFFDIGRTDSRAAVEQCVFVSACMPALFLKTSRSMVMSSGKVLSGFYVESAEKAL